MKKVMTHAILAILFGLSMILELKAQENGIVFTHKMWGEYLQQAREQNKLIFLDAYTTWCGPCKMLSKNVFTDSKVGALYNSKFINVKMDMEKDEGLILAKRYEVKAYPTLLFVNYKGDIVHRSIGYHDVEEFLELGKIANDPERNFSGMEYKYRKGDKSPTFLSKFSYALQEISDPRAPYVAEEYLMQSKDWKLEENWPVVADFSENIESPLFAYLTSNASFFIEKLGKKEFEDKINSAVNKKFGNTNCESFSEVEAVYKKYYPTGAAQLFGKYKLNFYLAQPDKTDFVREAKLYYKQNPSVDPTELNEVAWVFYENSQDKSTLKTALKWVDQSINIDRQYFNLDTKAALLFKLGKKKEALKYANEAIQFAKSKGEDPSETEKLVEKIKMLK